jgi:hypothetical protein
MDPRNAVSQADPVERAELERINRCGREDHEVLTPAGKGFDS